MKPTDTPRLERVLQDADRILHARNDTPIAAIDGAFYAHYAEELRLIVEDVFALHAPKRPRRSVRVWLLWNCADPVGAYPTEAAAREARADLQHRLLCDYGRDTRLLETVTITPAILDTGRRP